MPFLQNKNTDFPTRRRNGHQNGRNKKPPHDCGISRPPEKRRKRAAVELAALEESTPEHERARHGVEKLAGAYEDFDPDAIERELNVPVMLSNPRMLQFQWTLEKIVPSMWGEDTAYWLIAHSTP